MSRGSKIHGRQSRLCIEKKGWLVSSLSGEGNCTDYIGKLRTHKKVVCIWRIAADTKQLHQVMELAMNVAAYLARGRQHRATRRASESAHERNIRTVTGAFTVTTFPSSTSSSRALWQSSRTSCSGMGRQARSCSMALSISLMVAMQLAGFGFEVRLESEWISQLLACFSLAAESSGSSRGSGSED
jgi:hypothetical protein